MRLNAVKTLLFKSLVLLDGNRFYDLNKCVRNYMELNVTEQTYEDLTLQNEHVFIFFCQNLISYI